MRKTTLMTHLVAGYPTLGASFEIGKAMARGGAGILEIQIPFSDPVADGPTIVEACHEALRKRITVRQTLALAKKLIKETNVPCVIMTYANPIFRYGITRFVKDAAKAKVTGIIAPDIPFDSPEGLELSEAAAQCGLNIIPVVSPGVPRERLVAILKHSKGFVYCTSRQGTTGANSMFSSELPELLKTVRSVTNLQLAVGFGVRSREDVHALAPSAEIIIAGSAFISVVKSNPKSADAVEKKVRELLS